MVKLPRQPPDRIVIEDSDLQEWPQDLMTRIHGTVGRHALPWYQLRHFGPTRTRFDPHPEPPRVHPDFAVMYAAADVDTAFAEVFQHGRAIVKAAPNHPYLSVWRPTRSLRLLNIRGQWPIRQGASHALKTGPHPVCRRWAHAIAVHRQRVDGILYTSAMTGGVAAALFLPSATSFPRTPDASLPLSHPGMVGVIRGVAARIGYAVT